MAARSKLLLLGWDAADWQVIHPLLDRGEMPALARLLSEGVMGDLATLEPPLSPILWNSIATGVGGHRHGILGFTEPDPPTGGVRPVSSLSRRVKALWNIAAQNGLRSHAVGWFASHPAEPLPGGVVVSDAFVRSFPKPDEPWPMLPGTVHPPELAETLGDLRMHFAEIEPELLRLFVPDAAEIDQTKEPQLVQLAKLLAEMCSLHNAATWILEQREWDFLAVYQPAIDHFSHGFMKFRAPRLPWIDERRFRLFRGVIDACYRFHDLMLARMLELAGPEASVLLLSDHGYHSGAGRRRELPSVFAAPALEHRSQGILVLRGPGLRRDDRIAGAGLLDIAPTALALLGLPAGADMEGRVLAEAWIEPPDLIRIPSWEQVPGESGQLAGESTLTAEESEALLQQFVDLGYVAPPTGDRETARQGCVREQEWNLAQIHLAAGRLAAACPLLEGLVRAVPERGDWALALANCLAAMGHPEAARAQLERIIAERHEAPLAQAMLGQVALAQGDHEASLKHLLAARQSEPDIPELPLLIARTLFGLGRVREAEFEFERAARVDPTSGVPHQGLAQALLRQRRWEEAAGAALTAVGYQFNLPVAHFTLGRALCHLGLTDRAEEAFRTAVSLPAPVWEAHRWLASLLAAQPGREAEAAQHRERARELQARGAAAAEALRGPRPLPVQKEVAEAAPAGSATETLTDEALPPTEFVLVSGLPRSGTSLVMQMLVAAGCPILTDEARVADADNPAGYLEWEGAKQLGSRPELINAARGKVVKIVSPLLPLLPQRHRYRIVFLRRPLRQVAFSQARMIARRKGAAEPGQAELDAMERRLEKHLRWTTEQLARLPNVDWLEVDYPQLVAAPADWARRIAEFCQLEASDETVARMCAAVRSELHRNR